MRPEAAFPPFFVIWAALCLVVWTFYWKGGLAAKRRWHPRIVVGSALLFLGFIALVMPFALVLAVPAVAAISFLNLKMTKFCGACEATLFQNPPWATVRFCSKCGTSLEP
jgi:hypothetical protein